ncbi:flavoprotein [Nocardia sp. NPDC101769]|uniref:flavoprotein n=1 Tax=Nocardia sp. NPDC101769 TaxID=3364333 RepID=UPI00381B8791
MTPAGRQTRAYETDVSAQDLANMADVSYRPADIGAALASGSFRTAGMIAAPRSIRPLSAIAYTNGDNLLTRAADVTVQERRRLVLMVRDAQRAGHHRPLRRPCAGPSRHRRPRPAPLGRVEQETP